MTYRNEIKDNAPENTKSNVSTFLNTFILTDLGSFISELAKTQEPTPISYLLLL